MRVYTLSLYFPLSISYLVFFFAFIFLRLESFVLKIADVMIVIILILIHQLHLLAEPRHPLKQHPLPHQLMTAVLSTIRVVCRKSKMRVEKKRIKKIRTQAQKSTLIVRKRRVRTALVLRKTRRLLQVGEDVVGEDVQGKTALLSHLPLIHPCPHPHHPHHHPRLLPICLVIMDNLMDYSIFLSHFMHLFCIDPLDMCICPFRPPPFPYR